MLILEAANIKKYYGDRLIISIDNLKVEGGDKIGIVGQNGAGKTTLLNILSGELLPDEGFVKRYCEAAYIKQFSDEQTFEDEKLLREFGVEKKIKNKNVSGGEKTCLEIAETFGKNNIIVMADEPTSNLDFKGIEILKDKLRKVDTLLLISHDRNLLDELCSKIIEIKDGNIAIYEGNYSSYQEQKEIETKSRWAEYNRYTDEKSKLEEAIINRQNKSKSVKKAPRRMGNSEARLHKRAANKSKEKINNAANNLKTRLERLEKKAKPKDIPQIKLDFSLTSPPKNKIIISCKNLSFGYDGITLFNNVSFNIFNGSKTAIVGENGVGKTTLLNLINDGNTNISIVPKASLGYFYQGFENLDYNKSVLQNIMDGCVQKEGSIRTILARLLITGDEVFKKVGVLSGGERIKVSLAKILTSSSNVLLLDEPTNYLDMTSLMALQDILEDYESTVVFVSHDKAFVNNLANRLLIIKDKRLIEFEGNLKAYEEANSISNNVKGLEIQKSILRMKLSEIISRMSTTNADKVQLEEEYKEIVEKLRKLEV